MPKQFVLILVFYVLTTHINIMTDILFNFFDECATICVRLFPQEEERTSSSRSQSKMYISGSIANSERMLTDINESGVITKISVWVESNTDKH